MKMFMIVCPRCGDVRKHGVWVHLSDFEMQEAYRQVQDKSLLVTTIYEFCPRCGRPHYEITPDMPV